MCGIVCVWFISTWTFVCITRTCHRGAATAFISTILSYNRFRSVSFLGTSSTASWTTLPRAPWTPLTIDWEMRMKYILLVRNIVWYSLCTYVLLVPIWTKILIITTFLYLAMLVKKWYTYLMYSVFQRKLSFFVGSPTKNFLAKA